MENLLTGVETNWKQLILECLTEQDINYINNIYDSDKIIYPPKENLFECFKFFDIENTKVIIIGQDPYHQPNQAHGLAFSVLQGKIPPSLNNIYKELIIENPYNNDPKQIKTGNLTNWAEQGVLLLNSSLTVEKGKPNIHSKFWNTITNRIITKISQKVDKVVYLLWGNNAQKKIKYINTNDNYIFKCCHPSPLSANRGNWFYNQQFNICNKYLTKNGKTAIDWLN